MRALDPTFADRVRETTLGLGGVGLLALLAVNRPVAALSFTTGVLVAILVWRSIQALVFYLDRETWRARDVFACLGLYFGKYAVSGLGLWLLVRFELLRPVAFTGGFVLPTIVVALKAVGLWTLRPEDDPVPFYSRQRKAGTRG